MRLQPQREAVVAACRHLLTSGLVTGTSGNISVRDTGSGLLAVSPSGTDYLSMTAEDVAVMDIDGQVVDGRLAPTTEAVMHLGIYAARPDVGAVVHTHSPFATTFAVLGEPVPAVHYILAKAGDVRVAPYARYGTTQIARACVETLGEDDGVLLANHGVVAVGDGLGSAMAVAEAIEFTAEVTWRARSIGVPNVLDADEMAGVAAAFSTYGRQPAPSAAVTRGDV